MVWTLAIRERGAVGSETTQVLRGKITLSNERISAGDEPVAVPQNGMTTHGPSWAPMHGECGEI
jgi:hypothetical protein